MCYDIKYILLFKKINKDDVFVVLSSSPGEDDDKDLSDIEEGEGDATDSKQFAKKQQVHKKSTYICVQRVCLFFCSKVFN